MEDALKVERIDQKVFKVFSPSARQLEVIAADSVHGLTKDVRVLGTLSEEASLPSEVVRRRILSVTHHVDHRSSRHSRSSTTCQPQTWARAVTGLERIEHHRNARWHGAPLGEQQQMVGRKQFETGLCLTSSHSNLLAHF